MCAILCGMALPSIAKMTSWWAYLRGICKCFELISKNNHFFSILYNFAGQYQPLLTIHLSDNKY